MPIAQQKADPSSNDMAPGGQLVEPRTIHRVSTTHHGKTLRTLGHAAEYLASSGVAPSSSEREAIHILMRLSREVFDDYAAVGRQRHPVADGLMSLMIRLLGEPPKKRLAAPGGSSRGSVQPRFHSC
jgi:hypothetical protein